MIINGIIAEYNPFHNGHVYHIARSKELSGADYTIVVMSGNFVQRGAPAIIDKHIRAKMALENGADLVLELPSCYSVSSAEYFAKGAVALLDKIGVVDNLSFGSEIGSLEPLQKFAKILVREPDEYKEYLQRYLRDGMTFPLARYNALIHYDPSLFDDAKLLESANNILGLEYLKALISRDSKIKPITITRKGSQYHDRFLSERSNQASAQAIREAILAGPNGDFSTFLPESAYSLLKEEIASNRTLDLDDFSGMLYYKLLLEKDKGFTSYLDVTQELSDRIVNKLNEFTSAKQFADLLKTRDRTYTRITRCLMHILLNLTENTMETYSMVDYIPYARVLGFRKKSEKLLTEIKLKSSIPLITNLTNAKNELYAEPGSMLKNEIRVNEIYLAAQSIKTEIPARNEFSTPIVIV